MLKRSLFPGDPNFCPFYPGSVVLVSAADRNGKADVCTVGAWSIVNGDPLLFGIAMCQRASGTYFFRRHTTRCIDETGEFVLNIPHSELRQAWNICGSVSLTKTPDIDKFAMAGLTPVQGVKVGAPLIAECMINIECRVHSRMEFSTHDWIVGEPLVCHVAKGVLDGTLYLQWETAAVMRPQE